MTPADLATFALGRGPCTVDMLAGKLMEHGRKPQDASDQARAALDYLVSHRKAERLEVMGCEVFRLPGSVPVEKTDDEPKPRIPRR